MLAGTIHSRVSNHSLRLRIQLRIVNVNQIILNPLLAQPKDIRKRYLELRPIVARIGYDPSRDNRIRNCPYFDHLVTDRCYTGEKLRDVITNSLLSSNWLGIGKNKAGIVGQKAGKCVGVKRV